jgi:hypothetical protein
MNAQSNNSICPADLKASALKLREAVAETERNPGLRLSALAPDIAVLLKEVERPAKDCNSCRAPCKQVRMKTPADDGPISGAALALRMQAICGCAGQYDCDCVTVRNRAGQELWTEYNQAMRGAAEA